MGGSPTPGIGFAVGIERILLVMESQGVKFPPESVPEIYVASLGRDDAVIKLCYELRQRGIWAECDLAGRSLKAQMKNAGRSKAKYSIVIGDNEIQCSESDIKNMDSGEIARIALDSDKIASFLITKR